MKLAEAIKRAERALAGDSGDEEHDALFYLVEAIRDSKAELLTAREFRARITRQCTGGKATV